MYLYLERGSENSLKPSVFVYFLNEVIKACEDLGAKDFQCRQKEEESKNAGKADFFIDVGLGSFI